VPDLFGGAGNQMVVRLLRTSSPQSPATDLGDQIQRRVGRGQPLPSEVQADMSAGLGHDFGDVVVHRDAEAAGLASQLGAKAFTTGRDVFFGSGAYDPGSVAGRETLAHELTHTIQQSGGTVSGTEVCPGLYVSDPSDHEEKEAAAVAHGLASAPTAAGASAASDQTHVQRDPTPAAPAKTTGEDLGSVLSKAALEEIRAVATRSTFLAGAYAERGMLAIDALRSSLTATSATYKTAYDSYAKTVRSARDGASNQQDWLNIFAGIAIGTGVGLLAGAIVPEGLALGWTILAEAGGEVVEAAVAGGVQATGITDVAGAKMEPGGIDPDLLSSAIWERLSGLYRSVLGVQKHTQYLPLILGNTEYLLGQFRLADAGAGADMDRAHLVEMAVSINRAAAHLRQLNSELSTRLDTLTTLRKEALAAPKYTPQQMEQDIWIMWMAELANGQSDILDLDEIEDHLESIGILGGGSRLGVDFGWWTSEDDELAALSAARGQAGAIRKQYDALMKRQ
jgi:hypothetical protein